MFSLFQTSLPLVVSSFYRVLYETNENKNQTGLENFQPKINFFWSQIRPLQFLSFPNVLLDKTGNTKERHIAKENSYTGNPRAVGGEIFSRQKARFPCQKRGCMEISRHWRSKLQAIQASHSNFLLRISFRRLKISL